MVFFQFATCSILAGFEQAVRDSIDSIGRESELSGYNSSLIINVSVSVMRGVFRTLRRGLASIVAIEYAVVVH